MSDKKKNYIPDNAENANETYEQTTAPLITTQEAVQTIETQIFEAHEAEQAVVSEIIAAQEAAEQAVEAQAIAAQKTAEKAIVPYLAAQEAARQIAIAPIVAAQEAAKQVAIAPIVAAQEAIERSPAMTVLHGVAQAAAAYKNMAEGIAETLVKYDNYVISVAQSIKNLASTVNAIQNTIFTSPVWSVFESIGQQAIQMQDNIERRYVSKKALIERWNALEQELKHQNRYFPKAEILTIFDECIKEASYPFRKGGILYRARIIDENGLPDVVKNIVSTANESINNSTHSYFNSEMSIWEYIENMPTEEWEENYANGFFPQSISFWGFDSKASDAPPSDKAQKPGRVNPPGIAYLYAATGFKTAIAEIQPMNGELVSVAKIQTKKKLKLFSFDFHESLRNTKAMKAPIRDFKKYTGKSYWELEVFFDTISELFSKPVLGNADNYYVTQYISEYIKSKGFDGIKFKSSLKKGGANVVLFDTSKDADGSPLNYDITETRLHLIKNVTVTSSQILPKKQT